MNGYFVTGTDTNVGKTFVTCALAQRARARGYKVFAFKPFESGATQGSSDQDLLVEAAGGWQQGPLRGLYQFSLPAAPLVAAEAEQASIDLALVVRTACDGAAANQATLTLVEGAGGWRVPITLDADMSTLAVALGLPVLVVARAGLGTINHTLLTVEAIQRDGLSPAAVVLSLRPDEGPGAAQRNRTEIQRRWPGRVLILGGAACLDDLLPLGPPASPGPPPSFGPPPSS